MPIISTNEKLYAISYETATFFDLETFVHLEGKKLKRIEPNEFLKSNFDNTGNFINLITKELTERQAVCEFLDNKGLTRFSFYHTSAVVEGNVELGCMIYPLVTVYPNVDISKDIIIHANSLIGHGTKIDQGTFISGGVFLGGGTKIGKFCKINLNANIHDKVQICDYVVIGCKAIVRKDVLEEGTYSALYKLKKL